MKNKIIGFIFASIVFISVYYKINVYAASPYATVYVISQGNGYKLVGSNSNPSSGTVSNGYVTITANATQGVNRGGDPYSSLSNAIQQWTDYYSLGYTFDHGGYSSITIPDTALIIVLHGSIQYNQKPENAYDSYDDYLNPPQPEVTWYQEMWDTLKEELGNPAFWFGQWFIDLIDDVYGGENDPTGPPKPPLSTHVTIGNPTLTPAPTPIPYSTIVIPKTDIVTGETVYETNYYYNISGTPIITSSPPTNTPSQNGSGNGNNYTPIGGDPYSIPQLSWLTNVEIGDNNYDGIDSVSDGLSSIDEIGSDYTDGMSAVQDATGTLPTTWILLIGVAAAIPLVAGLISRFLS